MKIEDIISKITRTVRAKEKLEEIAKRIAKLEAIPTAPMRAYITYSIKEGIRPSEAYEELKGKGLGIRKQVFLAYYEYILQEKGYTMFAYIDQLQRKYITYKTMSHRDILKKPETFEHYDSAVLETIADFMRDEFESEFRGWRVLEAETGELCSSKEFDTAGYENRTYEFEVFFKEEGRPEPGYIEGIYEDETKCYLPSGETQYFIVYSEGEVMSARIWQGFNYGGFKKLMKKLGKWE